MRSYAKKLGDENFIHNIISIAMRYSNLGKKNEVKEKTWNLMYSQLLKLLLKCCCKFFFFFFLSLAKLNFVVECPDLSEVQKFTGNTQSDE